VQLLGSARVGGSGTHSGQVSVVSVGTGGRTRCFEHVMCLSRYRVGGSGRVVSVRATGCGRELLLLGKGQG
jgi:hypothetical protein